MYAIEINASTNNIPIAFDDTANSKVGTELPAGSRIMLLDCTEEDIAFSIADYQSAPSSDITVNRNQGFVIANGTSAFDSIHISNRATLYVRSAGSIVTSGKLYIMMWGHR